MRYRETEREGMREREAERMRERDSGRETVEERQKERHRGRERESHYVFFCSIMSSQEFQGFTRFSNYLTRTDHFA